ncbi:MAG: YtxH domain-containing protein [Rhizobacter sp.]|nr:YtxH domain-containing protein [Ferruginibacter sp.]
MTKKKIVTGLVAGLAIGGVLGYLFATEKGAKTRKKIADETGSFFDEVVGHFMDMMQRGKDKANNLLEEGSAAAEKVKMSGNI